MTKPSMFKTYRLDLGAQPGTSPLDLHTSAGWCEVIIVSHANVLRLDPLIFERLFPSPSNLLEHMATSDTVIGATLVELVHGSIGEILVSPVCAYCNNSPTSHIATFDSEPRYVTACASCTDQADATLSLEDLSDIAHAPVSLIPQSEFLPALELATKEEEDMERMLQADLLALEDTSLRSVWLEEFADTSRGAALMVTLLLSGRILDFPDAARVLVKAHSGTLAEMENVFNRLGEGYQVPLERVRTLRSLLPGD